MPEYATIEYHPLALGESEQKRRGQSFFDLMSQRRSVRHFSDRPVPRKLVELASATASTSPSGAHRQPWRFVAISDPEIKNRIRVAAETEERESYEGRMPQDWLKSLAPIGTSWQKPYLEMVPWIIVVFEETYGINPDGSHRKNYYVKESVGMACGLLIAALQNMGLASLTHTPSPMAFLSEILSRPANEKPYVLIPVGYAADDCTVPDLKRKPLEVVSVWV
jgi:nitroreductase